MRLTRASAAAAAAAVLVATACTQGPTNAAGGKTLSAAAQKASLTVLPQIAQQGTGTKSSSRARGVAAAQFSPHKAGRPVTFYKKSGSSWRKVGTTKQRSDGTAYWYGATRNVTLKATAGRWKGASAKSTSAATGNWAAKWGDEFGGSRLNTTRWAYRNTGQYIPGQRERSAPSPKAVKVGGGTVSLKVMRDPDNGCKKRPCYLNGQIDNQLSPQPFSFTHGVASARLKFPQGRGQHGAMYLQSPTYYSHPGNPRRAGTEIDVVEFFGKGYSKGGLGNFLFYNGSRGQKVKLGGVWSKAQSLIGKNDRWWKSYHVFSVDWTSSRYTFLVDGKVLWTTTKAVSNAPEFMVLSLLTSDWELPALLKNSKLPTQMKVDWVKVWQRS